MPPLHRVERRRVPRPVEGEIENAVARIDTELHRLPDVERRKTAISALFRLRQIAKGVLHD